MNSLISYKNDIPRNRQRKTSTMLARQFRCNRTGEYEREDVDENEEHFRAIFWMLDLVNKNKIGRHL